MKHFASPRFWGCYHKLPKKIQRLADKNFELLKGDPSHGSLRFKKIGNLLSVRVGAHFRALALDKDGDLLWFWIGSHADCDKILR